MSWRVSGWAVWVGVLVRVGGFGGLMGEWVNVWVGSVCG